VDTKTHRKFPEIQLIQGTISDIEQIKKIKINKQFSSYDLNELAIRGTLIVLRKC
jgi:hypothetical protein